MVYNLCYVCLVGMVGALAVSKDGTSQSLLTTTESLGSTRQRITAVDICYGKSMSVRKVFL